MKQDFIKKFKELPKKKRYMYISGVVLFILFCFTLYVHTPPRNFPFNDVVTVNPGESLQNITNNLYEANVIRFPFIFRSTVIILGGERKVIAGDYLLDEKVGPINIAYRLIKGDFHTESKKITIPEGWDNKEIADYLEKNLLNFDKDEFLNIVKDKEGYLFPDTYFIANTTRPRTIVNLMESTFDSKIRTVNGLATSTRSLHEILTMASILEGEALTTEDRRIVAGILWRRMEIGMPLQVDATFSYVNGKTTFQLTLADLKIDSPYNTYRYKGLPPTPINNPGLDAINAALNPIKTKYLYFLTSNSGKMYYARTFEEHKRNKKLHIYN